MPPTKSTKPKRPPSGYSLFYRYKRIKVLEATAALLRATPCPAEEKSIINGVLAAPPGLEGIGPSHSMWDLSPHAIDEFRVKSIRRVVDGRLFLDERTLDRLYCKAHGRSFVEVGKLMRDLWAGLDAFTKDIFFEMADAGKVRHGMTLPEYKPRGDADAPTTGPGDRSLAEGGDGRDTNAELDVGPVPGASSRNSVAVDPGEIVSEPGALECASPSPVSAEKQQVAKVPASSLQPASSRPVNKDLNFNDPPVVLCGVIAPNSRPGDEHSLSNSCLVSLEPLALQTPTYQRQASTNSVASNISFSAADNISFYKKAYQDVNAELEQLMKGITARPLPQMPLTSTSAMFPEDGQVQDTARPDGVGNGVGS